MRQHHAGDVGLAQVFEIGHRERMIGHHAVFEMGAGGVDFARTRFDVVAAEVAHHAQHAAEVVQRVIVIDRRGFEFRRQFVIIFAQRHRFAQIEVVEGECEVAIVSIKIRHDRLCSLCCHYALALKALIICGITAFRSPTIA
ncbi:hypothetical protein SDC9_65828 [bioreactor metagenome]|uniref:Uncharacterized protein n=1 Tax=bioreactor metagenome TaxID=1076179 RepID=A0A644XTC0_9ZZZZ